MCVCYWTAFLQRTKCRVMSHSGVYFELKVDVCATTRTGAEWRRVRPHIACKAHLSTKWRRRQEKQRAHCYLRQIWQLFDQQHLSAGVTVCSGARSWRYIRETAKRLKIIARCKNQSCFPEHILVLSLCEVCYLPANNKFNRFEYIIIRHSIPFRPVGSRTTANVKSFLYIFSLS